MRPTAHCVLRIAHCVSGLGRVRVSSSFVKFRQRDPNVTRGSTACSSLTPPPTLTQPETLTQPRKHCVQLPNHTPPTLTQPETLTQHWAIRNAQCAMRSCAHEAGADAQCAMRNAQLRSRGGCRCAMRNAQCAVALTRRPPIRNTQCAMRSCAHKTQPIHTPVRNTQYAMRSGAHDHRPTSTNTQLLKNTQKHKKSMRSVNRISQECTDRQMYRVYG